MPCTQELFYICTIAAIITNFLPNIWLYVSHRFSRVHSHLASLTSPIESIRTTLSPPGVPLHQLLQERSLANTRLSSTLGLSNTFVDSDLDVHNAFVKQSRVLLRNVQAGGWTRFQAVCGQAVENTLDDVHSSTISFDHFVQVVVLRSVLAGLLAVGKDVDELEYPSLTVVTSLINELWTLSKSGRPPPVHLSQQLHQHLQRLIPASADFPNPIDYVVPTWETMWRVCATTVARTQELEEYKQFFHEFLETDSLTVQRMVAAGSQGYSMRDFVEEVMRLHPPVKHIHRLRITQPDTTCPTPSFSLIHHIRSWIFGAESPCTLNYTTLESADIGAALRAQSIWSHDAHVFDPFRHRSASPQMNEAKKMVFGYGPLRCVALAWAPDAAAVMSATILVECERLGWNIVKGERIGGRTGWDGWKLEKREE